MTKDNESKKQYEANFCIGTGVGIGALGVGSALALGATCPICFIAAPALIGVGAVQKYKTKKQSGDDHQPPGTTDSVGTLTELTQEAREKQE